ncbi:tRNA adenosine(34) deaminase TadA [Candidatus Sororendozoicomonas aggregata]|uniref:tRNA adenosine(34) deaminase TadA n=1 Tax=Candidatus Sororendozoicomonas aggregata TaxID=3073239 RepID=UPI002ED51D0C
MKDDTIWMEQALVEARKAAEKGEVPVGAVIVLKGAIIARGHNQPISGCNPVAHAEILTLQAGARALGNYRLVDCELFVTLEPCTMCAGAIVHSRIRRLVYGALEPKAGAIESVTEVLSQPQMNYRVEATGGVLADKCGQMISDFFKQRRLQIKKAKGA